jgi:hypothetical protein
MRDLCSLFLDALLLHTVSYAQDLEDVEIDPNGAVISEKQAEVEAVIKFLNVSEAFDCQGLWSPSTIPFEIPS